MSIYEWSTKWNVPMVAIHELLRGFGLRDTEHFEDSGNAATNESTAQSEIRLDARHHGVILWRNNVGALKNEAGRPVRYGLANDTPALNKKIKSGDLIGAKPIKIEQRHVGTVIGQFVSREAKPSDWTYTGTEHEEAQKRWMEIIINLGGDAAFATGKGSFDK